MLNEFKLDPKLVELQTFCLSTRRELHKIPETSGQEFKTSKMCATILEQTGYHVTYFDGFTGFIADLTVSSGFKTLAIRADMDALPMPDLTEDKYKSNHDGVAHNCGHDTHMAIALTAAKYLIENQNKLTYNVRFIFQMAEEDAYTPGADKMVELGCMVGVDEVYALHNNAALDYGHVDVKSGIMSSYGRSWNLYIEGISAHASTPHKGLDAIREGTRIIAEMDHIVAKKTNPFSPAVFACCVFNGGTVANAVAANVHAQGTIRSMDDETDTILCNSFLQLESESNQRGYKTKFVYEGYPAIINHPIAYQRIVDSAKKSIPEKYVNDSCFPMTASEDFSFMVNATKDKCGAMFFLGTGNEDKGIKNYLHSNPYYIEESSMIIGAQIFINLATTIPKPPQDA